MHIKAGLFLLLFLYQFTAFPQNDSLALDNQQIVTPPFLPVHPLGIFTLRLADDFRMAPPAEPYLHLSFSSGNCWSPPVTAYIPTDVQEIERMRSVPWHIREFMFQKENTKHQKIEYAADGVMRELRLDYNFKIEKNHEVGITSRAYYLTGGEVPTALITSDQFIEWFHTDIYKDHDPFARRIYGYNKAGIRFQDREGRVLEFNKDALFVPATEIRHIYYPAWLNTGTFAVKAATYLALNHHAYNSSLDGGLSLSAIKLFNFTRNRSWQIGLSSGLVRRKMVASDNNIDLIEAKAGFNLQGLLRYNWLHRNKGRSSMSLSFHNQSAYYTDDKSYNDWVLSGVRYTSHWAVTMHHLFRNLQAWTLAYQYVRKYTFTWYLQEDLLVNNGPDIQAGFSVGIPIAGNSISGSVTGD